MFTSLLIWSSLLFIICLLFSFIYFAYSLKITPTPSSRTSRLICLQFCQKLTTLLPPLKSSLNFIDLGSGWGGVLFYLARKGPSNWRYIGYEIMPIAYIWSWILSLFFSHVQIKSKRFQTHLLDSSHPTLFFSYLCPEQMHILAQMFQQKKTSQTLLLTLTFTLPHHTPLLTIPIPHSLNQSLEIYLFNWPELENLLIKVFPMYHLNTEDQSLNEKPLEFDTDLK